MAKAVKSQAKIEKRKKIEVEMREIVIHDSREILLDNLRRRRRREFSKGDKIRVIEYINPKSKNSDVEFIYRISEGIVCQVTDGGYFVEGQNANGRPVKDFINRAHIINGFVKLFAAT